MIPVRTVCLIHWRHHVTFRTPANLTWAKRPKQFNHWNYFYHKCERKIQHWGTYDERRVGLHQGRTVVRSHPRPPIHLWCSRWMQKNETIPKQLGQYVASFIQEKKKILPDTLQDLTKATKWDSDYLPIIILLWNSRCYEDGESNPGSVGPWSLTRDWGIGGITGSQCETRNCHQHPDRAPTHTSTERCRDFSTKNMKGSIKKYIFNILLNITTCDSFYRADSVII